MAIERTCNGDSSWVSPISNAFRAAAAFRRWRANASTRCCKELEPGWTLTASGHLLRVYEFRDFAAAMAFANRVGDIAEQQGHHPDLHVAWGRCGVEIWTHKIDGLTESDFFLGRESRSRISYLADSKFWNLQRLALRTRWIFDVKTMA